MALFSKNEDAISEELLKKSMDASANVQEVVIEEDGNTEAVTDIHSLEYLINNGIDANAAIDILGDKDTFNTRLKNFASMAKSKYGRLMECKANMNMNDYSKESYELKKESNYLGIDGLFLMAKTHEQKAKVGDTNYVIENFKEYEDEIMRIIKVIGEYFG